MNALVKHKLWLAMVMVTLLVVIPGGALFAADAEDGEVEPPSVNVTLDKKTPEVVITTGGQRYKILEQGTVIVGLDGQQVELADLSVPCDARIVYVIENGAREALLITMTSVSANASMQFIYERPE